MRQWTIDKPEQLTFASVSRLNVRIVAGRLAVLASDGPAALEVTDVGDPPLIVTHDDEGVLTVTYKDLTWEGLLGWLRPGRRQATLALTVPKECPVNVGVVSASAVVTGLEGRTSVKSVSGDVVLDGVSGEIHTDTVSGDVESRGLVGDLSFKSVSGDLTIARGTPRRLSATTVSGRITADLELPPTGHVTMNSVSGEIMLRLPSTVETDVTIRSTSGRLGTAFTELDHSSQAGAKTLTGRIGGGMASLTANTVSADVTLLKGAEA
ncbi:hypothetical protein FHS43_005334 [Streptosporangium becharense]|uniref:DUF4097 domain-containing protein n=1 Tax=Streptosporangium becharense TaxID=1816182 RepID=A0A7W9IID5_9ACTN|nr:DUF4097 family beta strand repeat-containing protein [Streptosporangium becharense]MBB2914025.1 hypothetical protein [Streptosporangium becharense]MBB5821314.1 hypothetical protein [Streptosporangium becharense]